MVSDERVIMGSYMGSSVPQRDIPHFADQFITGKLPIDRLLTAQSRSTNSTPASTSSTTANSFARF
jgi:Zn-dependent alcohol dehydrogenase